MSYVVCAENLDPKAFDDVVGQETIATTPKNPILHVSDRKNPIGPKIGLRS